MGNIKENNPNQLIAFGNLGQLESAEMYRQKTEDGIEVIRWNLKYFITFENNDDVIEVENKTKFNDSEFFEKVSGHPIPTNTKLESFSMTWRTRRQLEVCFQLITGIQNDKIT